MTCDQFKQQGVAGNMSACMAFVMPKVAQGGACTQDFECTTGNCEGDEHVGDPLVDGMCAAAPVTVAIGQSCAANECVDGAYCDSADHLPADQGRGRGVHQHHRVHQLLQHDHRHLHLLRGLRGRGGDHDARAPCCRCWC